MAQPVSNRSWTGLPYWSAQYCAVPVPRICVMYGGAAAGGAADGTGARKNGTPPGLVVTASAPGHQPGGFGRPDVSSGAGGVPCTSPAMTAQPAPLTLHAVVTLLPVP